MTTTLRPDTLERMQMAIDDVRQRLLRITKLLDKHGISYAIVGGHALANWVAQVRPLSVRQTRDVDVLVERGDLQSIIKAGGEEGFIHRKAAGIDMLLDGQGSTARNAVHIVFANEKVRAAEPVANPDLSRRALSAEGYYVLDLEGIVQIKLTSFRLKDQAHLMDLIQLRMIDRSWVAKFPKPLAERLEQLLDHPDAQTCLLDDPGEDNPDAK